MENRLEILRLEIDRLIYEKQPGKIRFFIEHIYSVARYCSLLAVKRNLNQEIGMTCGMLHDIANVTDGGGNHSLKGAEQAELLLKTMNLYNDEEIKIIITAISRHSDKQAIHEPYDELLKDADVMSHCFYNPDFSGSDSEIRRYTNILIELGNLGSIPMECKTYPFGTLGEYIWADIISFHNGKWIFSKHKKRTTWETQGGHIEKGETPLEAAKRELFEESGVVDFDIEPLCDYWAGGILNGVYITGHGQAFLANVRTFTDIPSQSEMEKICLFDSPPSNLTYPHYSREIFPLAIQKKESLAGGNL
jgi:8-oxo-dGTP diphosphatase